MQSNNYSLFSFNDEFNYNEATIPIEDETQVSLLEPMLEEESSNVIRLSQEEVSALETQNDSENEFLYDFESNPISFDSK